ncbi:MAG: prevent-host-death protein [Promicromonosporaceae bacterium]|nr:prevent-host-death protein [Promicromonosporaceae bacterium]
MRTLTATAASRGFSELLDAVAHGDTVTIIRSGEAVAEVRPVRRHTFAGLRAVLASAPGFDGDFAADVASASARLGEDPEPWAGA